MMFVSSLFKVKWYKYGEEKVPRGEMDEGW